MKFVTYFWYKSLVLSLKGIFLKLPHIHMVSAPQLSSSLDVVSQPNCNIAYLKALIKYFSLKINRTNLQERWHSVCNHVIYNRKPDNKCKESLSCNKRPQMVRTNKDLKIYSKSLLNIDDKIEYSMYVMLHLDFFEKRTWCRITITIFGVHNRNISSE